MNQFDNSEDLIELDLCSYYFKDIEEAIKKANKRLSKDGILKLEGVDFDEIARAFSHRYIKIDEVNDLLKDKVSFISLEFLVYLLNNNGFKVVVKRLNDNRYYIEAKRS